MRGPQTVVRGAPETTVAGKFPPGSGLFLTLQERRQGRADKMVPVSGIDATEIHPHGLLLLGEGPLRGSPTPVPSLQWLQHSGPADIRGLPRRSRWLSEDSSAELAPAS